MKKQWFLPAAAMAGGAAAFVLRLLQNRTGFESGTGLPVPDAPAGLALIAWLAATAALFCLLVRRLPAEPAPVFPADFTAANQKLMALPVAGILLIAASGLADLYEGLGMGSLPARPHTASDLLAAEGAALSPRVQLLLGLLSFVSAAALFLAVAACRRNREDPPQPVPSFNGSWLLMPPVVLVARLVLTYRIDSINPTLEAYYVELLALVFLTLGFYRLSSFAFGAGRLRHFALYACTAVVLCCAALADGGPYLSSPLLYAGGGLVLMGFLLLCLAQADSKAIIA